MRAIKFRVWDSISKAMHPWLMICNNKFSDFSLDHYTLEQFTGLQDKNGVDIYEGDLVRVHKNENGLLKVEFKNQYVGGWVLTHESTDRDLSLGARFTQDLEVIGNIHQDIK